MSAPEVVPAAAPRGYAYLPSEPGFDPDTDLELVEPEQTEPLSAFGYDREFTRSYPSDLAVTSALRILSDSGVAKARAVVESLRGFAVWPPGPSGAGSIRGAVYRSRFLRDLAQSPELGAFLGRVAGTPLSPTPLTHQLAHINLPPRDGSPRLGDWHLDENSYVYVVGLYDRSDAGGRFQYFRGLRWDAFDLLAAGDGRLAGDRVSSVAYPGPGWGVFLQGSAVVHRAEPSRSPAGRISLVSALDPVQAGYPDRNPPWLVATGYGADGNGALEEAARLADFARGKAWRSRNLLDQFLADDVWSLGPEEVVRRLTESVRDIVQAATVIRAGEITMEQALGRHLKQEQELARRHRGGS